MARKYLPGGALNPEWCDEQDAALLKENVLNNFYDLLEFMKGNIYDMNINIPLGGGVDVSLYYPNNNTNIQMKEMCTIIDIEKEYEAKFNFIKRHSGTPEDLQLAKEIVGLK